MLGKGGGGPPKGYNDRRKVTAWGLTAGQKKDIDATRALYRNNFELFCKRELFIIDRESSAGAGVKLFEWNEAQKRLNRTIDLVKLYNLRRSKKLHEKDPAVPISEFPVQLVILKPRKVGISTFLQARALWRCEFEPNIEALILAHEYAAAKNIASISKRYLDLWQPVKNDYRKKIDKLTDKHITWGVDPLSSRQWGSKMNVSTAGFSSKGSSRGFTYHYVHISEEAHFKSESEVSAALAATVPFKETYEESTANGIGGMFYDNFMNSADIETVMNGSVPENWNGKFRFFFAWYEDPAYKLPVTPEEEAYIKRTLSDREKQLIDQFKCSIEQLSWRRYKIGSECTSQSEMDPEDYFNQEYPTEPDDAFVTSGANAFSLKPLTEMHVRNGKHPVIQFQGHLSVIDGPERCLRMKTSYDPSFIVYTDPQPGAQYILGVDTAVGLQHGDNSVISVWHRKSHDSMEEVARVISKSTPDELASMAVYLGEIYNDAFIVPEANPPGNATCLYINKLGYHNVFIRENVEKIGEVDKDNSFMYGFITNARTKPLLVSAGQDAVRGRKIWIRSKTALRQWEIFRNADGRYMAPEGEKDDCVMADLLAVWAHFSGSAPLARKFQGQENQVEISGESRALSKELTDTWERIRKLKKHQASLRDKRQKMRVDDILGKWY